jgi:hypothetical protein
LCSELVLRNAEIHATIRKRDRCCQCIAQGVSRELAGGLKNGLARFRGEGGDEHKCLDVLVADGSVQDDLSAIGMADKDDGTVNARPYILGDN